MKTLSNTSITLYLNCPEGYKLHYLEHHPTRPAPPLNKGSAVHAALEIFYKDRLNGAPPLTHVLDAFDEAFDDEAYLTFEEREDAYADGTLMVQAFYEKHAEYFKPAMAVEQRLRFEVDGIQVMAVIDRIDKLADGRVRIVDYKTGKLQTREQAEESPQLSLYQIAVEDQLGLEVESLELYHVPSQTPITVPRRTAEQLEEARARVREVVRGVEAGEFEPIKQARCNWCDWREHCSLFADWYPENWPQEPPPPAPSHEEARALADRFGQLKDEIKGRDTELAEVREALERFFEETGERAVAGEEYRLTASRHVDMKFPDDEALRTVLEPAGLWEKILAPAWQRKAKLLTDPEVPEEVKAKLAELAEEKVGWRITPRTPGE
jgi:putative RecB family exonuclease